MQVTLNGRLLGVVERLGDGQGWVSLVFDVPRTARPGQLLLAAEASNILVEASKCSPPLLVEVGEVEEEPVGRVA